jgi:hypothetical protein
VLVLPLGTALRPEPDWSRRGGHVGTLAASAAVVLSRDVAHEDPARLGTEDMPHKGHVLRAGSSNREIGAWSASGSVRAHTSVRMR